MTEQEIKDRMDNNICLECGKSINKNYKYFCEDCYENSMKRIIENCFNNNNWSWIVGFLIVASLFGFDGDNDGKNNNN